MCLQNVTTNHRACDVIVCEGKAQVLSGRFMYGPLDVVTLTGEKVQLGSGGHQDPSNRVGVSRTGHGAGATHSRGRMWLTGPYVGWWEKVVRTCKWGHSKMW